MVLLLAASQCRPKCLVSTEAWSDNREVSFIDVAWVRTQKPAEPGKKVQTGILFTNDLMIRNANSGIR
jgi:hypothetical protein